MTAKEYLQQYRQIDGEITSINEDILRLRELATQTTSGNMTSIPQGPADKTEASYAIIIQRIIDMEQRRNRKITELLLLKHQIESVINAVQDIRYRTLLRDKYINGLTLEQIAVNMNYCWRYIATMHGRALQAVKIAKVIK